METPDVPASEAMSFRVALRTRWSDEDTQGVLNNAVYPTLLEEARLAWCRALGWLDGAAFPFLLAQTNVVYLRPGRGGVEVEVELATVHVGRTSFEQAYRVLGPAGGDGRPEAWCEARARLVVIDPDNGRPVPIPEAVRGHLAADPGA